MRLYPRKCHTCGCGMEEGHIWDNTHTFCGTDCLTEWLYNEDICYYTTWDVESDGEVYDAKGNEWKIIKKKEEKQKCTK